jgi:hypothetical protein
VLLYKVSFIRRVPPEAEGYHIGGISHEVDEVGDITLSGIGGPVVS